MLLFFDIDGTIFDDRRRLPASVLPAMEEAHRRGHRLIINTGRTLCNPDHRLDAFPLDGAVMGCGTRILYHGNTLQSMEYPPAASLRLRNLFLELRIPVVYECDTAMYFDPESPGHPVMDGFRQFAVGSGICRDLTENDPDFRAVKMFCFTDSASVKELERRTAEAGMPYTAIDRRPEGWELTPSACSKGKGMDILREKLGVRREDCFAFGDSNNDLTMFAHAGCSIAMGNATDDVKAICSYVTDRPENNGIEKAMKHFGLI
jgi:Cof subfamily protein (haloacid dehalogenase superfamily)